MSSTYKFRAEVKQDADTLLSLIEFDMEALEMKPSIPSMPNADIECTVTLKSFTLDQLRDYMRTVEDGHVMVQTVAEAQKYTGERNFDLV